MSDPRAPLIVGTTRHASEQAARLGVGRPLENAVRDAIAEGGVLGRDRQRDTASVDLGAGVVATVKRCESPLTGRKAWRVLEVRRADG